MDRLPTASLFFFWCIILFSSTQASAQITKGYWMVGGNASWNSYNDVFKLPWTELKSSADEIRLNGSVGYFFKNKFSGGLRSQIWMIDAEFSNGGVQNQKQLSFGPFVRYYFLSIDNQLNIFTDVSYLIGKRIDLTGINSNFGKHNILNIILGMELFINQSVGLELLGGYKSELSTIENESDRRFRNFYKGMYISLGFQFHLIKQ